MINRLTTPPAEDTPIMAKGFERPPYYCSMSLVFIFLCATNQAKAPTLKGTFVFHKKLVGQKGKESKKLDKAEKNEFTKKAPEEDET